MLEIKDLYVNYGAVHALNGVSMTVKDGEIVSLIGANGAGKTTTLRTITGLEKAASGSITFDGHDLRKIEPSKIITLKLAHVPEGRHISPQMTVKRTWRWELSRTQPIWSKRWPMSMSVPPLERAQTPAGWHPFRRRAADAGRRPRPDGKAQDDFDG